METNEVPLEMLYDSHHLSQESTSASGTMLHVVIRNSQVSEIFETSILATVPVFFAPHMKDKYSVSSSKGFVIMCPRSILRQVL